jgi:hypothetical protein
MTVTGKELLGVEKDRLSSPKYVPTLHLGFPGPNPVAIEFLNNEGIAIPKPC